jgi:hypothetical protein
MYITGCNYVKFWAVFLPLYLILKLDSTYKSASENQTMAIAPLKLSGLYSNIKQQFKLLFAYEL